MPSRSIQLGRLDLSRWRAEQLAAFQEVRDPIDERMRGSLPNSASLADKLTGGLTDAVKGRQ